MTNIRCRATNPILKQALIDIAKKNPSFNTSRGTLTCCESLDNNEYTCFYFYQELDNSFKWGLAGEGSFRAIDTKSKDISISEMAEFLSKFKLPSISLIVNVSPLTTSNPFLTSIEVRFNPDKSVEMAGYKFSSAMFDEMIATRNKS